MLVCPPIHLFSTLLFAQENRFFSVSLRKKQNNQASSMKCWFYLIPKSLVPQNLWKLHMSLWRVSLLAQKYVVFFLCFSMWFIHCQTKLCAMLSVVSFSRLTAMKNTRFSSYCFMHNVMVVNKGSALRSSLDTDGFYLYCDSRRYVSADPKIILFLFRFVHLFELAVQLSVIFIKLLWNLIFSETLKFTLEEDTTEY